MESDNKLSSQAMSALHSARITNFGTEKLIFRYFCPVVLDPVHTKTQTCFKAVLFNSFFIFLVFIT